MSDIELSVNDPNEITIERCPHDDENPYAQISRALIRDESISPACRWLMIYLLSMKDGWKTNVRQVINHLKGQMGKNAVYKLFEEAINAGYMLREVVVKDNLKNSVKYFISERQKFKKILRRPENRDTENRDPENGDYKKEHIKKEHIQEYSSSLKVSEETNAAVAAEERVESSSKPKKSKVSLEFSDSVKGLSQKMCAALHTANPHWLIPKNLHPLMKELVEMIEKDGRDPKVILDVFMWAVCDHFWLDKICKPNPVKYLRQNFGQLAAKMNAKAPPNPNQVDRRLRGKDGKPVDEYKDFIF